MGRHKKPIELRKTKIRQVIPGLTPEQEEKIFYFYRRTKNPTKITRLLYNDDTLDVRSGQGRLVKAFMIRNNLEIVLNPQERAEDLAATKEDLQLNKSQVEFLSSSAVDSSMTPLEIARLVYSDMTIMPLSQKHRSVMTWLKENRPEVIEGRNESIEKWIKPQKLRSLIDKINEYGGQKLTEDKLTRTDKLRIEALKNFLGSPRVNQTINAFETDDDRELFEAEYVRAVWDKPDLTVDEQNLYVNVCANYVRIKHLQKQINQLNKIFEEATSDGAGGDKKGDDLSMRLSDAIKAKSTELNQCEQRVESLIKKLNGDRSIRLEKRSESTVSIQSLIQAWQDEEERLKMIHMAEMQTEAVMEEQRRLETMDEMKARILGLHAEDVI